jgi:hypothetical protein
VVSVLYQPAGMWTETEGVVVQGLQLGKKQKMTDCALI